MIVPRNKAVICPFCDSDKVIGCLAGEYFYCICYDCSRLFLLREGIEK